MTDEEGNCIFSFLNDVLFLSKTEKIFFAQAQLHFTQMHRLGQFALGNSPSKVLVVLLMAASMFLLVAAKPAPTLPSDHVELENVKQQEQIAKLTDALLSVETKAADDVAAIGSSVAQVMKLPASPETQAKTIATLDNALQTVAELAGDTSKSSSTGILFAKTITNFVNQMSAMLGQVEQSKQAESKEQPETKVPDNIQEELGRADFTSLEHDFAAPYTKEAGIKLQGVLGVPVAHLDTSLKPLSDKLNDMERINKANKDARQTARVVLAKQLDAFDMMIQLAAKQVGSIPGASPHQVISTGIIGVTSSKCH